MADIQGKILSNYGIDIAQENIFRLYKLDKADATVQELQELIDSTLKRWNLSINGANEKNAERDRARLEKADKYEAILRNNKLRNELYAYYYKGGDQQAQAQSGAPVSGLQFAREYFKLIETSKKLKKDDVEFFFDYYQSERKNKKAILEMLDKEFKIKGLGNEGKYAEEGQEDDIEGKRKNESSPMIVNLFQEATVIKLRKCIDLYYKAAESNDVCQKYPAIRESLCDFIGLKGIENIQQFLDLVSTKGKEIYIMRQERGTEYVPLVDLFNTLQELAGYRDVVDNLSEFKLLIKYPNLTPYMYSFVEMRPNTLKGIIDVANKDYVFRDDTDFILNYFNPVHDNFGISSSGISSLIKKAEKKAKSNKILNDLDEKLGRKKKRKLSFGAEIIHWLVYWPIFIIYFIFEVFKIIFTRIHKIAIPVFVVLFVGSNWLFPKLLEIDNLLSFRKIFSKSEWYAYLHDYLGETIRNGFQAFLLSVIVIIITLAVYILPSLFIAIFISETAEDLNKRYDWVGYERTFVNIFQTLRRKTEDQYIAQKKLFYKKRVPKVMINIVSLVFLILVIHFVPIGFKAFSENTGYFQKSKVAEVDTQDIEADESLEDKLLKAEAEELKKQYLESNEGLDSDNAQEEITMVITEGSSNIRSGPSVDYDALTVASKGDTFIATGNMETASNGRVWYEVYLNEDRTQTGWASAKVIEEQ